MSTRIKGVHLIFLFFFGAYTILNPKDSAASPSQSIVFGYIKDASPVSSGNGSSFPSGYCGELAKYLDRNGYPVIARHEQTYAQRFKAFEDFKALDEKKISVVANKQPAVECGPHSITSLREDELKTLSIAKDITAKFTNPFFVSSMKLLIKKDKLQDLKTSPSQLKIGAPKSTTNNQAIRAIYPNTVIGDIESRSDAVYQLGRGLIDAYSGDEVLLIQMMKENGFSDQFSIEPKLYGFTHEEYGIVVYNSDELLQAINKWIASDEGQHARRKYLNNRNQIANVMQIALNNNHFFAIVLVLFIGSLILFLTHPLFILFVFRLLPVHFASKILANLVTKSRSNAQKSLLRFFFSPISNYFLIILACRTKKHHHVSFVTKEETITLIRRIGIQPLFEEYQKEGLTDDQAKKKLFQKLAEIEKSDPWFSSILRKWLNVSTEQSMEKINSDLIRTLGD